MNDRIVLVFDVGTQSSRAELVSDRGEILGKSQIPTGEQIWAGEKSIPSPP